MHHTTAIARTQVAANPVVVELIVVGTGAEGDATAARGRKRIQRVAHRSVAGDCVVVHVHVLVRAVARLLAIDQARRREKEGFSPTHDISKRKLGGTHDNSAGRRAMVAVNPVIGNLRVVVPAMHEDRTAAL